MFAVKSSDAVSRLRLSPNANKKQSDAHGRRQRLKTPVNKLSCAGWLPHDRDFVLGCLVLDDERRRRPAHNRSRGFPAVALPPAVGAWKMTICRSPAASFRLSSRLRLKLTGDGPDKSSHLACDRGRDDNLRLPACSKTSPSTAQPNLRLPGNVAHILRHCLKPIVQLATDACLHAVGPGSFDQGASRVEIAGLCDPTSAHRASTRML